MEITNLAPHDAISKRPRYASYVLAILVLVGVLAWVDRQILGVLLQAIKTEFGLTDTQLGALGGIAFGLFYATVGLPIAWLADNMNRARIIAISLFLWSLATAASGFAVGFSSLFLARIAVGIGEAGASPSSQALVVDYFPPERRAFALGALYMFMPIGYAIAYAGGGYLNDALGWRGALVACGAPGLLVAALVWATVRDPRRRDRPTPGSAFIGEALRQTVSLIRKPELRGALLAGAFHGLGAFGAAIWLPSYLQRSFGASTSQIGFWLAASMVTFGLAGTLFGGWYADRLTKRTRTAKWYARLPACMLLASIPFLVGTYYLHDLRWVIGAYAITAFLNQAIAGPIIATLQTLAGPDRRATVGALYLFTANIFAMGLGPLVIGLISDLFAQSYGIGSLRHSLLLLVPSSSLLAVLLLWWVSTRMKHSGA